MHLTGSLPVGEEVWQDGMTRLPVSVSVPSLDS